MKIITKQLLTQLVRNKRLLLAVVILIVAAASFIVYVGLSIQPSELQVVTRYSAFGITHFYRDQWFYLISFGIFGLLMAALHCVLAAKLVMINKNSLATTLVWFGVALIGISWATCHAVFKVAALS